LDRHEAMGRILQLFETDISIVVDLHSHATNCLRNDRHPLFVLFDVGLESLLRLFCDLLVACIDVFEPHRFAECVDQHAAAGGLNPVAGLTSWQSYFVL
jgi:hypothetical protein